MAELKSFYLERDEFNRKLGDGFPPGSLVVLEGGSGSGKSITCQRICFGLLANNASVSYISTQLTTRGFIAQMQSLDYPIGHYLLNGKLLFLPVLPLLDETKPRSNFIQRLMAAKMIFKHDVVIIDTISSLVSHSTDIKKTLNLVNFFKKMGSLEKTIILAIDSGMLDYEVANIFGAPSDIYLMIKTKVEKGDIRRYIVVNKFAGSEARVTQTIGFRIEYWCPTLQADFQRLRILYYDMKNEAYYGE
ncbi:MAG: ATPase domain-containing protein [Euryarchaeota archaeon]|nr:ATPase domain-containing protein [Euryarchaeota archaeon]